MRAFLGYLGLLPAPLAAALAAPGAPTVLAGLAAGLHFVAASERQPGRALAGLAAVSAVSLWLPLPALCLLGGACAAESLLAESRRIRLARAATAVLCLQIALFSCNIDSPPPPGVHLPLAFLLAAAAMMLSIGANKTASDPLLSALFALLFFSFALSVNLAYLRLGDYAPALAATTAGFCAAIAAAAFLLAPLLRGEKGFESIAQAFALEAPLDPWIREISQLAAHEKNAAEFLAAAARRLSQHLPGTGGVGWQIDGGEMQSLGDTGGRPLRIACPPIAVIFYRRRFASPWTWFNHYLLCRIVCEYYLGKRREEERQAQNLLRAVHHAGALITHDIKNILHILAALASSEDGNLTKKQLPALRRRLESALDKLRAAPDADFSLIPAAAWWREAQDRHAHSGAHFSPLQDALEGALIPAALFDRALDNFLENARRKQPPPSVRAALLTDGGGAMLQVSDDGRAADANIAAKVFRSPLPSKDGFGVSLYQLAREAEAANYHAELQANLPGKVVFALRPKPAAE